MQLPNIVFYAAHPLLHSRSNLQSQKQNASAGKTGSLFEFIDAGLSENSDNSIFDQPYPIAASNSGGRLAPPVYCVGQRCTQTDMEESF